LSGSDKWRKKHDRLLSSIWEIAEAWVIAQFALAIAQKAGIQRILAAFTLSKIVGDYFRGNMV
jgi:hypothetical protein